MLRVLACVFAITVPLLSQGIGVPFSMNGGSMQVQGTFTGSGGSVCCSGALAIGGDTGTFWGKPAWSDGSGITWLFVVNTDEGENYGLMIHVNTQGKLTGHWYITGTDMVPVPLYP